MLCTPSHKWWTFTVIALARYLTRALGYEPLEPNLTGIQENSSREMKLVGQLSIPSSFGLHLMPAGNQSRLGSVQFWEMRGGRSTCSSCSKAKANEKKKLRNISPPLASTRDGAGGLETCCKKQWHCWWEPCSLLVPESLSDWPQIGQRPEWPGAGLCRNWAPGLFPLVRDETIWVLWFSNPPPRSNNYKSDMPGCHWPQEGVLRLGWLRATSPGDCPRRHCQV